MAENRRNCSSCGTTNEADARFCEGCGGSLTRVCATCGVEASATARFCRGCGASLDALIAPDDAHAGAVRKTVTVMFADLAGSTSFEERVDAETARDVIGRYHGLLRSTAQKHRAGVTKYIGDGFMAVWGVPETGPDDAGHAVEAAVELQDRFVGLAAHVTEAHGVELALRVAVNTGEVVVGEGDADLVGDALNVGARLEAECPRGEVVVGEESWRSTRGSHRYESLGQVQVKGRTVPVMVYQWLGRQAPSPDATPFVGRADETARLQTALDDATAARAARLVTVIGDPGVGKTRLAAEFVEAQCGLRVIQSRCDVEETVALAPIVELLRTRDLDADIAVGVPERDRILRDLTGLASGVPSSVEETFWALRRFVEALASDGPLLLVLDDIQWADTLLLDFVEHLVEWVHEVPVLVLALARPELREVRTELVSVSRWVTAAVHLNGLDASATAELATGVLGAAQLPDELLGRLPSSTGGNPLFVRELIGMLVHDGVLVAEPAGWRLTIDVDAITIPPTIHALLASRLERLDGVDRRLLEIASVAGYDFSLGAVCALGGRDTSAVKASLDRLRRRQLAEPSGAYSGDEPVWRFHHALIRDVAYRRLLKSERADLHERLANWVQDGGASLASDPDEMVARHLESAHAYLVELGTLDDRSGVLALRAARGYLASARRALDRDELLSAGTQAARGARLAADDDALRADLLLIACEAFLSAGDVTTCAPLVDDLEHVAGHILAPWATCYRCQFIVYTDPKRLPEVDALLHDAIDEFARRKDPAGLAKAHRVRAGARSRLGRIADCETDLLEALIAARQSGDQRQITAALSAAPSAALWGPSPVPKAGGRCLDVVRMQRMATAAPSLEATSLRCLAILELLRGRPDKARSMLADARQVVADLGLRHGLMETELFAGIIESMVGDPVAAEPHFRTALAGLDALGVGADAGQAAALLARSVLTQGRIDDADSYAAESERLAGHNLKTAIAWRAVRAEILAARGRHDEAVALAREAVAVAADTDLVLDHADACLALGRVLAAAGDTRGASAARRDATSLYAAKEVVRQSDPTSAIAEPAASPAATNSATSRLAITNGSCGFLPALEAALRTRDVDAILGHYSERFVYDDHRRLSFEPIVGLAAMRAAIARIFDQYTHFEIRVLAVRGQHLHLLWTRWIDDDGNETTTLYLNETDEDGLISYHARFDEDDFGAAYRELERRYYAGEGAAFAINGETLAQWLTAMDRLDIEAARTLAQPEYRWLAPPSALTSGDLSVDDQFRWLQERARQVSSVHHLVSAIRWMSSNCCIGLADARAAGLDGEEYTWRLLCVGEFRDGRLASVCQFELDDEEAAFAYAEGLVAANPIRLAVANEASAIMHHARQAMRARDVDAFITYMSDRYSFDDRRGLTGDPIEGHAELRAAAKRVLEQYSRFGGQTLAVRGQHQVLARARWSDDDGNETNYLQLYEADNDGRMFYEGRFDEDDFEGAYRELERRYYAGEGAKFAEAGRVLTEFVIAVNRGEFDRISSEITTAEYRVDNRSRSLFGARSAMELRAGFEELSDMVESSRDWFSATVWLSPTVGVVRSEREAVGRDGELYTWARLSVGEIRDGQIEHACMFDLEAEQEAFAYAEERVRASATRLAVANMATEGERQTMALIGTDGYDASFSRFTHDQFRVIDRRAMPAEPCIGCEAALVGMHRLLTDYPDVDVVRLAVRGQRLALVEWRCRNPSGFVAIYLNVHEVDESGRLIEQVRFDGDDFAGAYRELERRYYAGEGASYAEVGSRSTDYMIAMDTDDRDKVFDEWHAQGLRFESRSRSLFVDRNDAEFRASVSELNAMVASTRTWHSAVCWLSPGWLVARMERRAVGLDGADYSWTQIYAAETRNGRLVSACTFDLEDEQQAFAYAEERMRAAASPLAVTNRAAETMQGLAMAMNAADVDATFAHFSSDDFTFDDRRTLSGDPIVGGTALRRALERILAHYPHSEGRTLAVRGERLALSHVRWWDDAGNESLHLHLDQVDDDGRICYEGRFEEDDFEGAYSELEQRYYIGEGAAFAVPGAHMAEFVRRQNHGDLGMWRDMCTPDFRVESRSRSAFGKRSAAEVHASLEELSAMVSSVRDWFSAVHWMTPTRCIVRSEREAMGQDGERYAWTRLYVCENRDGSPSYMCQFEAEDEDAAFAYAAERAAANY